MESGRPSERSFAGFATERLFLSVIEVSAKTGGGLEITSASALHFLLMRRRWGLASFLSVLLVSVTASAQEAEVTATASSDQAVAPSQAIAYGAMPGGLHAPTAETLPKGAVQVSTLSGLGRRSGLLGPDHKFNRAIGDLAIAFGATDMISIGLSLDGRYDKHWGSIGDASKNLMTTTPAGGDDGYVGDPHLFVRL